MRAAAVCCLAALLLVACGTSSLEAPLDGKKPVVVDGDFGPDDMMALLYLLQQPELSVRAVTVTGTGLSHCPDGAANAMAVLDHVGHGDIPVACGDDTPLEGDNAFPEDWRQGSDALATQLGLVPADDEEVRTDATRLLADAVKLSPEPVQLLALGPLTNVAQALALEPDMAGQIDELVIMGGAVDVHGSVEPDYMAEWNIWVDPRAAREVLDAGVRIKLVPLDATNDVPATWFFYEALQEQKATPAAELVDGFFTANLYNLEGGAYFFWDPLAAVALVDPGVVTIETRRLSVVEAPGVQHGALVESPHGAEVQLATSADRHRFEEAFLSGLNGGVPAVVEIPAPDLTVRFTGSTCSFEGATAYESDDPMTRVVVELVNESESPIAVAAGLHEGVSWEQLEKDAAELEDASEPPSYWVPTGSIVMFGASVTGGRTTAPLDLAPGVHALACVTDDNQAFLLADLVVGASDG